MIANIDPRKTIMIMNKVVCKECNKELWCCFTSREEYENHKCSCMEVLDEEENGDVDCQR